MPLAESDPRLRTQVWNDARVDRMDGQAVTELRDLDNLARWFGNRVFPIDVTELGQDTAQAIADHRNPNLHLPWRRPHPGRILVEAALAHLAVGILTAEDADSRFRRFMPLFRDVPTWAKERKASLAPKILSAKRIGQLSLPTQQAVLAACDPHLPVSERLRYYTATPAPRLTKPGPVQASERARWIPQRLWQEWLVRFAPAKGAHTTAVAVDIPAALMLPGNPVRNIEATVELAPWRVSSANTLTDIARTYPDVLQAVCNLADWIDAHGGAIDYRCRRNTFTDIELPEDVWLDICARSHTTPGRGTRLLFARLLLFQMLTGTDILTATALPGNPSEAGRKAYNSYFRWRIPLSLRTVLHEYAAGLLKATGIDEPVTWSPPSDCITGLCLPGVDPDTLTAADIIDPIEDRHLSPTAAAAELGTTVEHIRYLMETLVHSRYQRKQRPVKPRKARPQPKPRTPKPAKSAAPWSASYRLRREFLQEQLVEHGKSPKQVAEETGFHIETVYRYIRLHEVTPTHRRPREAKVHIDPGWLRQQTQALKRTNTEIADELGISHETVRKARLALDLEAGRTGVYHTRLFPDLPDDIRAAVEGQQDGWTRLLRFQQAMDFPSMNIAAQQLGYFASNLNLQINRLEEDIGTKLIERGHRYQPMQPTPRGRQLLKDLAANEVQELLKRHARKEPFTRPSKRKPTKPKAL